jgi:hypothetical protein
VKVTGEKSFQSFSLARSRFTEFFGLVPGLPDFIKSRTRMAQVRIKSVIERSEYGMKRALEAAVQNVLPEANIDRSVLFREFKRAVGRKCPGWITLPESDVRTED